MKTIVWIFSMQALAVNLLIILDLHHLLEHTDYLINKVYLSILILILKLIMCPTVQDV